MKAYRKSTWLLHTIPVVYIYISWILHKILHNILHNTIAKQWKTSFRQSILGYLWTLWYIYVFPCNIVTIWLIPFTCKLIHTVMKRVQSKFSINITCTTSYSDTQFRIIFCHNWGISSFSVALINLMCNIIVKTLFQYWLDQDTISLKLPGGKMAPTLVYVALEKELLNFSETAHKT